jgi:CubicO group peptidase (beta-lactamase class C family)
VSRSLTSIIQAIDLRSLIALNRVPGCSVAVTEAGRTTVHTAGVLSSHDPRPVDANTIFQACSLSKPVSVLAATRFVEDGTLAFDDDVSPRLAGWRLPADGAGRPRVSFRQLASHTAGLSVSGFEGYRAGADVPTTIEILAGAPPAQNEPVRAVFEPGVRFQYSGGGTTLVQLLIESITGRPAVDYLDDFLARELGMSGSGFLQPLPPERAEVAARGHDLMGRALVGGWRTYPELCAAGLWSTPSDLSRFLQTVQMRLHRPGPEREAVRAMLTPEAALESSGGPAGFDAVGMGFFLKTERGTTTWFGHDGSNAGYRCHMLASARDDRSLVVMTNGDGGGRVLAHVLQELEPVLGVRA